jgi:hypothetical protein
METKHLIILLTVLIFRQNVTRRDALTGACDCRCVRGRGHCMQQFGFVGVGATCRTAERRLYLVVAAQQNVCFCRRAPLPTTVACRLLTGQFAIQRKTPTSCRRRKFRKLRVYHCAAPLSLRTTTTDRIPQHYPVCCLWTR